MNPSDIIYVVFMGGLLAASCYGVWAEHIDDNVTQRTGMVVTIFGAIGEISGTVRGADSAWSMLFVVSGVALFGASTFFRCRSCK